MEDLKPNYKKIFEDIVVKKCPERFQEFNYYFNKENLTILDVIELNNRIFGIKDRDTMSFNQQHKSYDYETIIEMLAYQKTEKLNNVELANHFNLSRNTVTKWKKIYLSSII